MPVVILSNEHARRFADGEKQVSLAAGNVRQVIDALEERFPGIKGDLIEGVFVTIDGTVYPDPFLEEVGEDSEVCFIPAIAGG